MLTASCLTLEINEFRSYEAKTKESEKAGSRRESNAGQLWLKRPVVFSVCAIRTLVVFCVVQVKDCEGW